jgi:hypothetical protein
MAGVLCCLVTLVCVCVPCICGWCQDVDQYCSKCNNRVTHKPHDGFTQVIDVTDRGLKPSEFAKVGQEPSRYGNAGVVRD